MNFECNHKASQKYIENLKCGNRVAASAHLNQKKTRNENFFSSNQARRKTTKWLELQIAGMDSELRRWQFVKFPNNCAHFSLMDILAAAFRDCREMKRLSMFNFKASLILPSHPSSLMLASSDWAVLILDCCRCVATGCGITICTFLAIWARWPSIVAAKDILEKLW